MAVQTSSFVKKLAANDRPTREAALESLRKFLSNKQTSMPLLEYQKLWKGLYYSMWFCDRPRPQQRLADALGALFSETIPAKNFGVFVDSFWFVMGKEWVGVDQHRIDKYYMLLRRVINHSFRKLQTQKWDKNFVDLYLGVMMQGPLSGDAKIPYAIPYHIIDIYIDELEKVMFADIEEEGEEKEAQIAQKKQDIIDNTPIKALLLPFERLNKNALLKTLRLKVKEDIFEDDRLAEWGIVEKEEEVKDSDDESDDEWHGF
ncbi:hypothetical protein BABINDRAFT_162354 [Babjeviella inositovora NRRL Y-12698]|uniref:Ribosomal RNA-processing protein 1 n=1 Tax=Babjeviella inositovora NRRL Y-12698 TaxID=984486 RepID=A0A1E3QLR7_9ASCO|nr:uncharacterized protein BABINDRAFT_162354 [Babjeviella inositovora NRRL Y-12698]ODQ78649.1 hypothetical protein BABINDRAFT_162354 [Babjeviella inositovora NRRL Y-12698]